MASLGALARIAVTGLAAIWGLFLVGGQWFIYWAGDEGLQFTQFFMLLWGIATLVFLA